MDDNPSSYTKKVIWLRRVLIGGAVLAALALIALSNTDRFAGAQGDGNSLRFSGAEPVIDNPDYQGQTAAGRAYRLTGTTARRDGNNDTILRAPRLVFAATPEDGAMEITAGLARLAAGDKASLQNNVRFAMQDGYLLQTQKLVSNLRAQSLSAPQPVTIDGPDIAVRAASLDGQLDKKIFTLKAVKMRLERSGQTRQGDK